ncbi:MAG: sterol desaturase family protein, partial [Proteobacteria bacterium]|nr:sterol desaturase family protein [Pseudomonadota bacterium]
ITLIDAGVARFLAPILPVGLALLAASRGWGVLNQLSVPYWASVLIGVLLLDLVIYLQHVMFHTLPLFWRLHGMHHTDLDIDVTSGLRFHPLEIFLSTLIKLAAVASLGVPAVAVVVFEVLLNGTSMFSHGNIHLGVGFDRLLRLFVVTPDMHRVHHSVIISETNSNFGFNFPWWDRLFGTYRPQPAMGHDGMTIGLARFRDAEVLTLRYLLLLPFRRGGISGGGGSGGQKPDRKADQRSPSGEGNDGTALPGPNRSDPAFRGGARPR